MTTPEAGQTAIKDAHKIWDYHLMGHELQPSDVGLGLGSHDIGVADKASELFRAGLFPTLVFSGATSPTTRAVFPEGEAVAYRDRAIDLGIPADCIIVEPNATNTGANFMNTKDLLDSRGIDVSRVLVICKPYMQRRSYATCRKVWPEVEVICCSEELTFDDYVTSIGDDKLVIDMLVGDLQRIWIYADKGFAIHQDVPDEVTLAYERLVAAGYTSRLA